MAPSGSLALLWLRAGPGLAARLRIAALLLQAPLVLFYLVLIPPALLSPQGPAPQPEAGHLLHLLVGAIMVAALVDLVRRADRPSHALSPLALGGLLISMAVPQIFAPFLPADDYHLGEYIYPWWALVTFGQIPYADYMPAHGLLNYLAGAASSLFFDGSVATFYASSTIVLGLLALATFVLLTPILGIGLAWLPVLFLSFASAASWMVAAAVFGALTVRPLLRHPLWWLTAWIVLGIAAVLLAPAQGTALVLGTIPAGLLVLYTTARARPTRVAVALGALGAGLLALASLVPLLPMTFGALTYLLENSGINAIAYGIPWSKTATSLGYEILRMAWIAVPLIAVTIALLRPALLREPLTLLSLGAAVLFPFAIFGYVMGRIDAGPSRMGPAVLWLGLVALPVLLLAVRARSAVPVALVAAIVAAALYPRALDAGPLVAAARPEVPIAPLTDARSLGLTGVGHVIAEATHIWRTAVIKDRLDALLAAGETYLDMTGRGARYVYAGRAMPVPVAAPYNMAHPGQQARAVARLQASTPPVALFAADNVDLEAQTAALRAHRLYRRAVQTYRPIEYDGYVYGLTPARWDALGLDDGGKGKTMRVTMRVTAADHTDVNWTHGVSVEADMFFLDSKALADEVRPGDVLTFTGSGARTVIAVDGRNVVVDGPLDPETDGYPNPIEVPDRVLQRIETQWDLVLLDTAFRIADLDALPVSWGASMASLDTRMVKVVALDLSTATLNDLRVDAEGWLTPVGPDPHLVVGLPAVDGASAGLFVTEFACRDGDGTRPDLQLFWTSERNPHFSEAASVSFEASDGWLIAPLDSQPRWLLADTVSRMRIDLADPGACGRFRLARAHLAQRSAL